MVSWDVAILQELKILGIHTAIQFILFMALTTTTEFIGFPGGEFILILIFIIGISTVNEDLTAYRFDGPSTPNSIIRTAINVLFALTTAFSVNALCDRKHQPELGLFELECRLGALGKILFALLFNVLVLSLIRTLITGVMLFGQIAAWTMSAFKA